MKGTIARMSLAGIAVAFSSGMVIQSASADTTVYRTWETCTPATTVFEAPTVERVITRPMVIERPATVETKVIEKPVLIEKPLILRQREGHHLLNLKLF